MRDDEEYAALVEAAASLYRRAGRHPYHFARGKLGHDPVFPWLLRSGLLPDRARILDLGCGQGVLGALLVAARMQRESGAWRKGWPLPPASFRLHGIELQKRAAQWAQAALGEHATVVSGDLRDAVLPDADLVVVLDVLHYLEPEAQQSILARIGHSLRGGGTFLLRVGDAAAGQSFVVTRFADKLSTLLRGQGWPRHFCRPVGEWKAMLERLGFRVAAEPMSGGTPFTNVLLIARMH